MSIEVRSKKEQELMRQSGQIAALVLKKVLESVKVGISALELDKIAAQEIKRLGGGQSYKTVPGYKYATCVTFNDQVVHGIPTNRKVKAGDLVSVDLAVQYKGWHTDTAWTILVSEEGTLRLRSGQEVQSEKSEKEEFLRIGKEALKAGIKQSVAGKKVGGIGAAIQREVEGAGFHVVRALVGHGVGKKLHEEPELPGYGSKGTGPLLEVGMTLAIEVIYAAGTSEVILDQDGWTYRSADGSIAGLFEMTVIVGKKEAKVLTDWRKV